MVVVAGKTVDFQGIADFFMGLKPDIISINGTNTKGEIPKCPKRILIQKLRFN